ncbi:hypothetical protein PsYK624_155390 [Phanerochaete sordida]|uniref:Uncharacterized protein n=1 Tax=Phanerochaete sordida TaxID=48140 RepID=A0A9P3GR23_9APHY|nr:hypothetical protein PsYK624_155390 [Phanerochaete sordida]
MTYRAARQRFAKASELDGIGCCAVTSRERITITYVALRAQSQISTGTHVRAAARASTVRARLEIESGLSHLGQGTGARRRSVPEWRPLCSVLAAAAPHKKCRRGAYRRWNLPWSSAQRAGRRHRNVRPSGVRGGKAAPRSSLKVWKSSAELRARACRRRRRPMPLLCVVGAYRPMSA